jgi:hypothetical protein
MPLSDYDTVFQDAGREWNVDPLLLKAVAAQESNGDPKIVSPAGAQGLMQIMPKTQQDLGVTNPFDPVQSIFGGAKYLSTGLDAEGSPEGALLYYHGGPGWRTSYGPESQAYVPAVTAQYKRLAKSAPAQPAAPAAEAPAPMPAPAQTTVAPADDPFSAALAGTGSEEAGDADPFTKALGAPADTTTPQTAPTAAGDAPLPPNSGLGASIMRGVHQATDIPAVTLATAADYVAGKLGYNTSFAKDAAGAAAPFNQSYDADPNNQGWEPAAARLMGNALVTIPASITAGGLASGAVKGVAAPLAARLAAPVVSGAAQGATTAAMTGDDVGRSAEIGGGLGAVGGILGAGVNKLLTTSNPAVEAAINKYNIPLRSGQVSDSKFVRYLDSQLGNLPGSGQEASNAAQRVAFNKAVANTFGEDAEKITPAVMQQAKDRIGGVMNDIASRTNIQADPALLNDLGRIEANAQKMPSIYNDVRPHITDILETAANNNGTIPGNAYQALTGQGSALSVAQQSSESSVRNYANSIREALDDAFQRSAAAGDVEKLAAARLQYKNMMTVAPLVNKGIPGDISPLLLQGAANRSFKSNAFRGAGDLGELGDIGQAFLRPPPDSGTATRTMINGTLYGDTKAAVRTGLGITAGRAVGSLMRANPLAGPTGIGGGIPSLLLLDDYLTGQKRD